MSLAACRGIDVVATSGDGLTALRQVALHHPDMLVIDANLLDEEVEALLAAAKTEHPAIRCLVLTRSNQHVPQLMAWGADAVARRNESAQQLQAALAKLGHGAMRSSGADGLYEMREYKFVALPPKSRSNMTMFKYYSPFCSSLRRW